MKKIMDLLFGSSPLATPDITIGELQEIVRKHNAVLAENRRLTEELDKKTKELVAVKQSIQLRVDSNYSGKDLDGTINVLPSELLSMDITGDVSIDAKDLCSIIKERDRYHGAMITQSIEIKRITETLTETNKTVDDMRVELILNSKTKNARVNLHGLVNEIGKEFDCKA
jgi:uncharacterized coiled-coil protein SlyX